MFCGGGALRLDNFRRLEVFGWPGARTASGWRQDKGQRSMAKAINDSLLNGGDPVIPADEIFEVARVTLECSEQVAGQ